MLAFKSVTQQYSPSPLIKDLMKRYIDAINLCIDIAIEKNIPQEILYQMKHIK